MVGLGDVRGFDDFISTSPLRALWPRQARKFLPTTPVYVSYDETVWLDLSWDPPSTCCAPSFRAYTVDYEKRLAPAFPFKVTVALSGQGGV